MLRLLLIPILLCQSLLGGFRLDLPACAPAAPAAECRCCGCCEASGSSCGCFESTPEPAPLTDQDGVVPPAPSSRFVATLPRVITLMTHGWSEARWPAPRPRPVHAFAGATIQAAYCIRQT